MVVDDISRTAAGTMACAVRGDSGYHYLLYRSPGLESLGDVVDLVWGRPGTLILKDRFRPTPNRMFYRVARVSNDASGDADGDGRSNAEEVMPDLFDPAVASGNPFNPIPEIEAVDGSNRLTRSAFMQFSIANHHLFEQQVGERFMKFVLYHEVDGGGPGVLFMNSVTHDLHGVFLEYIGEQLGIPENGAYRGELAWEPTEDGRGRYFFNLQEGQEPRLSEVMLIYEVLTKNAPVVDGNLFYRPVTTSRLFYQRDKHLYDAAGIPVHVDDVNHSLADYTALNPGVAFGLLRELRLDERPSLLDIALYQGLPNDVGLVRGIITGTPQTPLSHVNLRAVQNKSPNAYIKDAASHPSIEPFLGKYVRYEVHANGFEISEVSQAEVEAQLESLRPKNIQVPPRDLGRRQIVDLEGDDIGFEDSESIGAKAANVAELIRARERLLLEPFRLPENAHAIPFYFYDEFMRANGLYERARKMLEEPAFQKSQAAREEALARFRDRVKDGTMPSWMNLRLSLLQGNFPQGQGIRCRSSTNNEDLPGFNGAGLYSSFTHHPDEGHLSKSIKQVYASLWNPLAFEHREFYRVDHFQAAMGVLLHHNFEDEKANGVAASRHDFGNLVRYPFYANVQVGEDLVTNPGLDSRPEELLLGSVDLRPNPTHFILAPLRLRNSNQVPQGTQILSDEHARKLSRDLIEITNHFSPLYGGDREFAMEIEFKLTQRNQLVIKQARPWVP